MTRKTIIAAGCLLSAFGAGAPAAFAHNWPGAGSALEQLEAEIPAGALPPGAATSELSTEGNRFRVRFEMPAAGPTTLRFWKDYRSASLPGNPEAVVRSDRGGTFRAPVELNRDAAHGPPLYLGGADGLAAFTAAVRATAKGAQLIDDAEEQAEPDPDLPAAARAKQRAELINGIELQAPSQKTPLDCRRLVFARFVVASMRGDQPVQGLLDCAARGAGVLIVGRPAKPDAAETLTRLGVGTRPAPWGLGAVAWFPSLQGDIAGALAQIDAMEQANGFHYLLSGSFTRFVDDGVGAKQKGVPGSTLVLLLLALYVAVIGPIGYFVGVRPRRAWLAWSWFPLVAIGATIALAAVSTVWRGKPAELVINRTSLLAPTGAGLENTDIRLQGSSSARYSVSVPWRDGDIRGIERGYRFGTPFARPAGTLALTDDRIAGRLDVDGLTVGRFGTAGVSWVQPVARGGAEIALQGDRFAIVNHLTSPIVHGLIRGATLCGQVDDLPVGAARTVPAVDCEKLKEADNASKNPWHAAALARVDGERPGAGAILLVAEVAEAPPVEARPVVKTSGNNVVMVRGPLLGDQEVKP